jgi:hypothetical protein
MDLGLLKSFALYLPILAFAVWEVVKLSRDPELRKPVSGERERSSDDSAKSGHTERQ